MSGYNPADEPSRRSARFEIAPLTPNLPGSTPTTTMTNDGGSSTRSNSPEPVQTPTLAQSYTSLKKNLSFKSLRELEMQQVQKVVWRKGSRGGPDEERYRPDDIEQAFVHATRGGVRSFVLGSSLRAGVNLVVLLLRSLKKGTSAHAILHALFGQDTLRFGGMMGLFSFLYKFVLHTLRLTNPDPKLRSAPLVWHAAVAGFVSGAAVWAEKPSRRVTIGQQMLVRGMQGNYNIAKSRGWINIPHGDVLLFGLSCGQIMYSWLLAPEALPSGYRRWVTNASRVPEPVLPVNLGASREGKFDPNLARKVINWRKPTTAKNASLIEAYAARAEQGDFGPPFAPCETIHPWVDSCVGTQVDRFQEVWRWMLPVYGALHFIPPMLLRRKVFMKDPTRALFKSAWGTARSCSFLATFVIIFQSLMCVQRNTWLALHARNAPEWLQRLVIHRGFAWLAGFSTCASLFIEEKKRRGELAMYVLPRGMEALWSVLRRRSYVPFVPGGEVLLSSAGLAMVMHTYAHEPKMLSGLVRSILYQFIGHG